MPIEFLPPNEVLCPPDLCAALTAYVEDGRPLGSFMTAVLENDLKEAVARADDRNANLLPHIVAYIYNNLPAGVWGSPEAVEEHLNRKRAKRGA